MGGSAASSKRIGVERSRGVVVTSATGKAQVNLSEVLQVLGLRGVMKSFPAFSESGKFPGVEPLVPVKRNCSGIFPISSSSD